MSERSKESNVVLSGDIKTSIADCQERWRGSRMSEDDFAKMITAHYLPHFIDACLDLGLSFPNYETFRTAMLEKMKEECPESMIPGSSMYRSIDEIVLSREEFEEKRVLLIKEQ